MDRSYERVELERDCTAVVIPSGEPMLLRGGEQVVVLQTLGGRVTVRTEQGYLVRINAGDSGALGLADPVPDASSAESAPFELGQVIASLENVFDPEIPINVVDLGLIYRCEAESLSDGGHRVRIEMSMTAPGCGMGDVLLEDARTAAESVPGVSEVDIELVWDPPWGTDRMSDAARLQLGLM